MKTFIALVIFLLLLLWLTSCGITHNENKNIIITSIIIDGDHCHYETSESRIWFRDACGLFNIGDTVSIQKVHQ
jgi:hypothetical protein